MSNLQVKLKGGFGIRFHGVLFKHCAIGFSPLNEHVHCQESFSLFVATLAGNHDVIWGVPQVQFPAPG